jgi:hypothetical protein
MTGDKSHKWGGCTSNKAQANDGIKQWEGEQACGTGPEDEGASRATRGYRSEEDDRRLCELRQSDMGKKTAPGPFVRGFVVVFEDG